jgi:hypothetical protein
VRPEAAESADPDLEPADALALGPLMANKRLRLLVCPRCKTVEPIEWCAQSAGANPECGHVQCKELLDYRVMPHTVAVADGHAYHSNLLLTDIAQEDWDRLSTRKNILKNLAPPGEATPYGADLFDVKENFKQDAMMCWKAHNRTHDCAEWRHSSKRLVPQDAETRGLRKELGLETRSKHRPTSTYLCDMCPMRSIIETKLEAERYGFKNPY